MEIYYSSQVNRMFSDMHAICLSYRHEFTMPEHALLALMKQDGFCMSLIDFNCELNQFVRSVRDYLARQEIVPESSAYTPGVSEQMRFVLAQCAAIVTSSNAQFIKVPHVIKAILQLNESFAAYILEKNLGDGIDGFLSELISRYEQEEPADGFFGMGDGDIDDDVEDDDDDDDELQMARMEQWRRMVTCLNDTYKDHNPLIGRDEEMERTIQVLCRKEKNNPLHIGEPGVGKTALVYGLAARIESGRVPERLKGCRVYQLDLGTMLAGTQFRGDFEKRIKEVMDGVGQEGNAIVYIDEIHNLVGAGTVGESSMDASNLLKPYLETGNIRFIGSTTYEEYKRYFERSKGLVRRFQQIDIDEPGIDEAVNILHQLKRGYEKFHGVKYADKAIDFAVRGSAKFVNDRFLPDKAIDLIDEAGAYRELHPLNQKQQTVDRQLVAEILSKTCKVDALAVKHSDNAKLATLHAQLSARIFGQDEAIRRVTEAVLMSKAGLLDDQKPLASLLFVGPTGVGKTEVARVLAQELGIELLRFDMSEYTEKHTVAKLIGSPAGYVGYEDGGLLTDAIRKTPNCVLLLDEIEKAHQDIYNVLLQVMDYARLTDNKGRKADFRNVILIMTSNAGAQFAGTQIGFDRHAAAGEAMLKQVKNTFKPEFINRLSGTVVFNDMNRGMAELILDKKLGELQQKLTARKVSLTLTEAARQQLLEHGFTRQYGAREMDRVIARMLKPLLMREILFGRLKKGGAITVTDTDLIKDT